MKTTQCKHKIFHFENYRVNFYDSQTTELENIKSQLVRIQLRNHNFKELKARTK